MDQKEVNYKLEQFKAQKKSEKAIEDALDVIIKELNIITGSSNLVAYSMDDVMHSTHRTLQQQFVKTVYEFLCLYADNEYFDARNEAAVKFAKRIKEMEDVYFPFI